MHVASHHACEKKSSVKLMGIDPGSKTQEEFNQHSASVTCQLECLLRVTSRIRKHEASGHLSKAETEDDLCQPMRHWMPEPYSLLYHRPSRSAWNQTQSHVTLMHCLQSRVFLGGGSRGGSANTSNNGGSEFLSCKEIFPFKNQTSWCLLQWSPNIYMDNSSNCASRLNQ